MTELTKSALCEAVRATLAPLFTSAQGPSQLKESIADNMTLQVYPKEWNTDSQGGNDRSTFGGAVRQARVTILCDMYLKQRAVLGEDISKQVALSDQVDALLDQQKSLLFGLTGIKAYKWRGERVTFEYANEKYVGLQYTLDLDVY